MKYSFGSFFNGQLLYSQSYSSNKPSIWMNGFTLEMKEVPFSSVGRAGVPRPEAFVLAAAALGLYPCLGAICCVSLPLSLILFPVVSRAVLSINMKKKKKEMKEGSPMWKSSVFKSKPPPLQTLMHFTFGFIIRPAWSDHKWTASSPSVHTWHEWRLNTRLKWPLVIRSPLALYANKYVLLKKERNMFMHNK